MNALDRIRMQIQWNRLLSVVEEQAQTLVRTAFSTSAREAGDISAGAFDTTGRMLAQAVTGTPGHVNAMAASVKSFLEKYPLEAMEEGDVFLTNDPWLGTGHLNDFTAVTPTFHGGRIVALFASTTHVVDIGGRGFGPDGRQVYEEGLNIPILPLAKRGEFNSLVLEIVRANVRNPVEVEGDLYSLAACNEVGGRRLVDMMNEFSLSDLDDISRYVIDASREGMLAEVRALPHGTYRNSMRIDGYERELDLVAAVTIDETGLAVDFDGTSPVSSYGINVPITYTEAYASFGVRCVIGSRIPNNAGSLAPVRVTAPVGTILNAPHPCAVTGRHVIGQMLPDVVLGCLGQIIPDRVPAEGTSCLWNPVLLGGHGMTGDDLQSGPAFAMNTFHTGGTGGRPGKDGLDATAFPSGVRNTPIEVNETIAPLVFWRKEYREDSGGPGAFRGGTGQIMEVAHAGAHAVAIQSIFAHAVPPPPRRDGGARWGQRVREQLDVRPGGPSAPGPERRRRRSDGAPLPQVGRGRVQGQGAPDHPAGRAPRARDAGRGRARRSPRTGPRAGGGRCPERPRLGGACPGRLRGRHRSGRSPRPRSDSERTARAASPRRRGLNPSPAARPRRAAGPGGSRPAGRPRARGAGAPGWSRRGDRQPAAMAVAVPVRTVSPFWLVVVTEKSTSRSPPSSRTASTRVAAVSVSPGHTWLVNRTPNLRTFSAPTRLVIARPVIPIVSIPCANTPG